MNCCSDFTSDPFFYSVMLNIPQQYYHYLKDDNDELIQKAYYDIYSKIYPMVSKSCSTLTNKDFPVNRNVLEVIIENIINSINVENEFNDIKYEYDSFYKEDLLDSIKNIVSIILVKEILSRSTIHSNLIN